MEYTLFLGEGRRGVTGFFRLSPTDYVGLHRRYAEILNDGHHTLNLSLSPDNIEQEALRKAFADMMRRLFREKGSVLDVGIMGSPET